MQQVLYRFLISALVVLSACNGRGSPPPSGPNTTTDLPMTILGAKVINGPGAEPIDDAVVVIRGTIIETIGTRAGTPVPKGGTIVDGRGQILIAAQTLDEPGPPFLSIETGAPADLVLLSADPLVNIQNLSAIERVMQAGQWLDTP